MGVVGIDGERELESASFVHAWNGVKLHVLSKIVAQRTFVRCDGQGEVQEIIRIWEIGGHGGREVEFSQVYSTESSAL